MNPNKFSALLLSSCLLLPALASALPLLAPLLWLALPAVREPLS